GADRQGRGGGRVGIAGGLHDRVRRHDGRGGECGGRRRAAGRHGVAVAGLRQSRHVSRLRSTRRCIRRRRACARVAAPMNATTMSYGVRARERMPFAWDAVTLGLTAALLLVGLIMVTSASMSIAAKDLGDPFYFLERQFVFSLVGLLCAWMITRVPAQFWDRYSLALLLCGLLLLLLVLVPGL